MNASELRTKSVNELRDELAALFKEQFNIRIQKGIGQSPQTHLFKKVRRQIARIKTILGEKEGL
jgi:large subunit ribosomal protein L29